MLEQETHLFLVQEYSFPGGMTTPFFSGEMEEVRNSQYYFYYFADYEGKTRKKSTNTGFKRDITIFNEYGRNEAQEEENGKYRWPISPPIHERGEPRENGLEMMGNSKIKERGGLMGTIEDIIKSWRMRREAEETNTTGEEHEDEEEDEEINEIEVLEQAGIVTGIMNHMEIAKRKRERRRGGGLGQFAALVY